MAVIRYDLCRPEAMGGGMEERHWSTVNSPVFDANRHVAYIIVRVEDVTEIINKNSGLEQDPHSANSGTSSKRLEMEISLRGQELERLNQQFREANDSLQAEIVERKNAEHNAAAFSQQLEQSNHDLQTVNQELEAFSYSVSHDLRAPLRAIDGFSRILIKEYADAMPAEAREYLEDVRTNTQQMGHLVDDLLAFSRLGRQPVNKQLVQPARVARQCFDDLIVQQPRRRVEIQIGALAPCSADVTLLKQVWTNLISNALKYTARRDVPIIEIGGLSENSSGEQTYFVKDNGVGFDMKYSNKLFGVFQRLHRAEDYEGTGVGLAIVQRIIHRHGGRVWAEAQPEKGATFYFTLQAEETQNA
jgi:light-regulated signal transduction histidine kinase (bacteriophytochrome)